jgi:hypothetical protein
MAQSVIHRSDLHVTRRRIIGAFVCAPAIVRVTSLMPVRALILPAVSAGPQHAGIVERIMYDVVDQNLRAGRATILADDVISLAEARRMVAHARAQGWLPLPF